MAAKFELYEDTRGEWRFNLKAPFILYWEQLLFFDIEHFHQVMGNT